MLTKLAFENFKSWRATGEIRLAPITALAEPLRTIVSALLS